MCLACFVMSCTGATDCDGAPYGGLSPGSASEVRDYTALLAYTAANSFRFNANAALGTQVFVTYSFTETADLPLLSDYNPYGSTGYQAFNAAQRANTRLALEAFSSLSGITFVETTGQDTMLQLFNSTGASAAGWANYPSVWDSDANRGRLVMNTSGDFAPGSSGFQVLLHEIGHAVGLKHPFDGAVRLARDVDNTANTLMSYTWSGGPYSSLRPFDVDAIRHIYGEARANAGWTWSMQGGVFVLHAAEENDVILGVRTANALNGGGGQDMLRGMAADDTLHGGAGNDTLMGMNGNDRQFGGAGRDRIEGGWGDDTLRGGTGNDTLQAGAGADLVHGEAGDDVIIGDSGANRIFGGDGNDHVTGGSSSETLRGDAGNDTLFGGAGGSDVVFGGDGDDLIHGNDPAVTLSFWDTLDGGKGDDTIHGLAGSDSILGGAGHDRLFGGVGWDTVLGGGGNDLIEGGEDGDRLEGGSGRDTLRGDGGSDSLLGGTGNDLLFGGTGNDTLSGEAGNDRLVGDDGNDVLQGGAGADLLCGGAGLDWLYGGEGPDTLQGGSERDYFVFSAADFGATDRILDFEVGLDRIYLQGLSTGWTRSKVASGAGDTLLQVGPGAELSVLIIGVDVATFSLADVFFLV